jgi:hypothetical protein
MQQLTIASRKMLRAGSPPTFGGALDQRQQLLKNVVES